MLPRNDFLIGQHDTIDYLYASVNSQLNLFNISQSPNQSDNSDPGSPESSHGGGAVTSTAGHGRLISASFGPGSQGVPTWPVPSHDDVPYIPRHHSHSATSYNSADRSTTSPYGHIGEGSSPEDSQGYNPVRKQRVLSALAP